MVLFKQGHHLSAAAVAHVACQGGLQSSSQVLQQQPVGRALSLGGASCSRHQGP